jgi:hypothetical protein
MDVEGSGIMGDGSFTTDPSEILSYSRVVEVGESRHAGHERIFERENPLLTASFQMGDVVFFTVYTMHTFMVNMTHNWRIGGQSVWLMDGDDVGPDPRYWGSNPIGLERWMQEREDPTKYGKSMEQAKREWGLLPLQGSPA